MPAYRLDCTCGEHHIVSPQQAGGEVQCTCGKLLPVPTLRKLRELAVVIAAAAPQRTTWGIRKQWACVGGVVSVVLGLVALWAWSTTPRVPTWEDWGDKIVADRKSMIEKAPPGLAFLFWQREFNGELRQIDELGVREVAIVDARDEAAIERANASGKTLYLIPGLEYQARLAAQNDTAARICGTIAAVVAVLTLLVVPFLPRG